MTPDAERPQPADAGVVHDGFAWQRTRGDGTPADTDPLEPPEAATLDELIGWGHHLRDAMKARRVTHREANAAWRRAILRLPTPGGTP